MLLDVIKRSTGSSKTASLRGMIFWRRRSWQIRCNIRPVFGDKKKRLWSGGCSSFRWKRGSSMGGVLHGQELNGTMKVPDRGVLLPRTSAPQFSRQVSGGSGIDHVHVLRAQLCRPVPNTMSPKDATTPLSGTNKLQQEHGNHGKHRLIGNPSWASAVFKRSSGGCPGHPRPCWLVVAHAVELWMHSPCST